LLKKAGLGESKPISDDKENLDDLPDLGDRINKILGICSNFSNNPTKMVYFVMYDIEDNKVRKYIADYLIKKGCVRVQKSIYLAETDRKIFGEIQQSLKEANELYDNKDSIFMVPVSTDELKAMKVIGKSIDFDVITGNKNTLFF
jgi:CRISPR-associated protein Cas2